MSLVETWRIGTVSSPGRGGARARVLVDGGEYDLPTFRRCGVGDVYAVKLEGGRVTLFQQLECADPGDEIPF